MKLVTFDNGQGPRHGVLSEDGLHVIDLLAAFAERAGASAGTAARRYGAAFASVAPDVVTPTYGTG